MANAFEYLDPEIAGEGQSANNWQPGAWTNAPANEAEEWQPDLDPPHINDYAAFKKHKHYGKYFKPQRSAIPFPAWVYHPTEEPKLIEVRHRDGTIDFEACKRDVIKLGPEWSPVPFKPRVDMTGKSLPIKSETLRLAEAIAGAMPKGAASPSVDANAIAAIVAAVMASVQKQQTPVTSAPSEVIEPDDADERQPLLDLAEEKGIKVDGRWSNQRLKKELGL